jgi:hypothetical protein
MALYRFQAMHSLAFSAAKGVTDAGFPGTAGLVSKLHNQYTNVLFSLLPTFING